MRQQDWLLLGAAAAVVYVLSKRGGLTGVSRAAPTPQPAKATDPWGNVIGQIVGRLLAAPQPATTAYDPTIGLPIEPSSPAFQDYWNVDYYPPESIGYR